MAAISRATVYQDGGHMLRPGDTVAVKYVTVIGQVEDFAVYMGLSTWSDRRVAEYGDKVGEAEARAIAPYCAHLKWRR